VQCSLRNFCGRHQTNHPIKIKQHITHYSASPKNAKLRCLGWAHWVAHVYSRQTYSAEEAQDELARRYFSAFGPATASDFTFWLGAHASFVKAIVERIKTELVEIRADDSSAFLLRRDLRALRDTEPVIGHVRLLPHFDVFLLAHRRKEHLIAKQHYKKVYRNAGWISPTILMDGKIAGTWKLEKRAKGMIVRFAKHASFDAKQKTMLQEEGERIGNYLGEKVVVRG